MICYTNKHKIPFQIDESDFETVSYFSWHLDHGLYVATTTSRFNGPQKLLYLPHFLLGDPGDEMDWDHWNRDTLDNRRDNLRAVTRQVNVRNSGVKITNTAGLKGIRQSGKKWMARINRGDGNIYLGTFETKEQAVIARQEAENQLWGNDK